MARVSSRDLFVPTAPKTGHSDLNQKILSPPPASETNAAGVTGLRQWKRAIRLIVQGKGRSYDLSEMRIRFTIHTKQIEIAQLAEIRIYNLKNDTRQAIKSIEATGYVQLDAGYENNIGTIFSGEMRYVLLGRENPTDTFVDIYAAGGDYALKHATVKKTFSAGSTPKDHWDEIMRQFKPMGLIEGVISGVDLTQPRYPRAVTLYGLAREAMRTLAHSKQAFAYVERGKVHLTADKAAPKGGSYKLSPTTGLIGMPTATINGGLLIRCLINPAISVQSVIQVDISLIQPSQIPLIGPTGMVDPAANTKLNLMKLYEGYYKIYSMDWTGDTRGQPWYIDMYCVGLHGTLPTDDMQKKQDPEAPPQLPSGSSPDTGLGSGPPQAGTR